MNLGDLLTPWLMLAAAILPLVYVEKWIHSHLYGVGWLLTENKKSATALYYLLLAPGVFVHEFTQYIIAGALNIKIKRVIAWPDAQSDGTLRLDFVRIQKANRVQAAVIGAAPLITGLSLVWVISSRLLSLDNVVEAIGTGDLDTISAALRAAASAPDFLLWMYVIFTISNAMLPTPSDRQGWPLLIGAFAVIMVFLVVIGVGDVLAETFTGPVAHGVERLATAFATVLIAEVPGILSIGFAEEILEKTTKRKFEYSKPRPTHRHRSSREPGSNVPLPPGAPFPSIYNLDLPIPSPAEVKASPPRPRQPASTPASSPDASAAPRPRPSFPASTAETPRPEREPRPAPDSASPVTRTDPTFPRRSAPPVGEDQPPTSEPRPAFRRPEDTSSPAARPDPAFPRRSAPPASEDQPPTSGERPAFRRPEGAPTPAAGSDPTFPRRSAPASEDQPSPDRFTRPQSPGAPTPFRREESADQPSGPARRPSPFADQPRRPSPFTAADEEDEDEDEKEEVAYGDFDDEDSVQDNIYGEDE